ncbi:MAG: Fe-S cluster assembly ATPase SufC [Anaerolineae bacterium]
MAKKKAELEIRGLRVRVEDKEILQGVDLSVRKGEIHALMGPNGSGKSTLAYALMGHPKYEVTDGEVRFRGQDLLEMKPNERAEQGLFLAFQYPVAIPGVTVANFLRRAHNAVHANGDQKSVPVAEFRKGLEEKLALLKMENNFSRRYLNDGFSGGEKKRAEILQMAVLEPEIAIMDETDSGLDIDALKVVAKGVNALVGPQMGALLITHYQRILNYITPHFVHVLLDGRIATSGGAELAEALEEKGYDWVRAEFGSTDGKGAST